MIRLAHDVLEQTRGGTLAASSLPPGQQTKLMPLWVRVDEPMLWALVALVSGDVAAAGAPRLPEEIGGALSRSRPCRLVLDLSRVTELPPAAVTVLRQLRRRCRAQDVRLVLVGAGHQPIHRPLRLTGLLSLFDTRPTVEHALAGATAMAGRRRTGVEKIGVGVA
jgi:anti-anti-sigma factor